MQRAMMVFVCVIMCTLAAPSNLDKWLIAHSQLGDPLQPQHATTPQGVKSQMTDHDDLCHSITIDDCKSSFIASTCELTCLSHPPSSLEQQQQQPQQPSLQQQQSQSPQHQQPEAPITIIKTSTSKESWDGCANQGTFCDQLSQSDCTSQSMREQCPVVCGTCGDAAIKQAISSNEVWDQKYDSQSHTYYYVSRATGKIQQSQPVAFVPLAQTALMQQREHDKQHSLPTGWKPATDPKTKKMYFWNVNTRQTTWTMPDTHTKTQEPVVMYHTNDAESLAPKMSVIASEASSVVPEGSVAGKVVTSEGSGVDASAQVVNKGITPAAKASEIPIAPQVPSGWHTTWDPNHSAFYFWNKDGQVQWEYPQVQEDTPAPTEQGSKTPEQSSVTTTPEAVSQPETQESATSTELSASSADIKIVDETKESVSEPKVDAVVEQSSKHSDPDTTVNPKANEPNQDEKKNLEQNLENSAATPVEQKSEQVSSVNPQGSSSDTMPITSTNEIISHEDTTKATTPETTSTSSSPSSEAVRVTDDVVKAEGTRDESKSKVITSDVRPDETKVETQTTGEPAKSAIDPTTTSTTSSSSPTSSTSTSSPSTSESTTVIKSNDDNVVMKISELLQLHESPEQSTDQGLSVPPPPPGSPPSQQKQQNDVMSLTPPPPPPGVPPSTPATKPQSSATTPQEQSSSATTSDVKPLTGSTSAVVVKKENVVEKSFWDRIQEEWSESWKIPAFVKKHHQHALAKH